jgi:hypothetical protein
MRYLRFAIPFVFLLSLVGLPGPSFGALVVGVSATVAPPPIPVYAQPPIPGPGYVWTPGYWAWGPFGYYWVPGTWILPPAVGLLWTPGYWGWNSGVYAWNAGYWGPTIGFYGGIDYGFGYFGVGYAGGYWNNGQFYYNTTVNNIRNVHITNVYRKTVNITHVTRVSYNGGPGGTTVRPTPAEERAAGERHVSATAAQLQQERAAASRPELRASVNHGVPRIAATSRPGEFAGRGIVAAHGAATVRPEARAVAPRPGARAVAPHPMARAVPHRALAYAHPRAVAPRPMARAVPHRAYVAPHRALAYAHPRAVAPRPMARAFAPRPHFAAPHPMAGGPRFGGGRPPGGGPHPAAGGGGGGGHGGGHRR